MFTVNYLFENLVNLFYREIEQVNISVEINLDTFAPLYCFIKMCN